MMKRLAACVVVVALVIVLVVTQDPFTSGAERLMRDPASYVQGKNIGLVCHKASVVRQNGKTVFLADALQQWILSQGNTSTKLGALFSPEHGLQGSQEAFAQIESSQSSKWGCPIFSLHGKHKKPTQEMLKGLDLLIVDFQEVGVGCYTYLSTLQFVLEAAADQKLPVLLLGRPNPLQAWVAAGPVRDERYVSFLGKMPINFVHGKTIAQLAQDINKKINASLTVIDFKGSVQAQRSYFSRYFVPPSPNLASIDAVYAYPMTVLFEGTNYSEGRGTSLPFVQIGAPWVDGRRLAAALNSKNLPGITFKATSFTPKSVKGIAENPKHKGNLCGGVKLEITKLAHVQPMKVAQELLQTMFILYPRQSEWLRAGRGYNVDYLVGTDEWRKTIQRRQNIAFLMMYKD